MTSELRALKQVLEYFDIDTTNVPEELYKVVFNAVAKSSPQSEQAGEKDWDKAIEDVYDSFCNWYHDDGSYDEFLKSEAWQTIKAFAALWQAASQEKVEDYETPALNLLKEIYENFTMLLNRVDYANEVLDKIVNLKPAPDTVQGQEEGIPHYKIVEMWEKLSFVTDDGKIMTEDLFILGVKELIKTK